MLNEDIIEMFKVKSVVSDAASSFEAKGAKVLDAAGGLGAMQRQAANDLIAQLRARGGEYSKAILVNHVLLWEDVSSNNSDDTASRASIGESLTTVRQHVDARRERLTRAEIEAARPSDELAEILALVDAQLDLLEECVWDGAAMEFCETLELLSGLVDELISGKEKQSIGPSRRILGY